MNSSAKSEKEEAPPSFSLASTSSLFSSRSNDIFGNLNILEQKHAAYQKHQEPSDSLERAGIIKHDPVLEDSGDTDRLEGKHSHSITSRHRSFLKDQRNRSYRHLKNDSRDRRQVPRDNFRHPRQAPPRSRKVPDFKKHPEKWTSYTLDDVSERDLSEKSNTRAALDFLWERKNEREKQERLAIGLPAVEEKFESETAACSKGVISFSKKKSTERKMGKDDSDKSESLSTYHDTVEKTLDQQDGGDDLFSGSDFQSSGFKSSTSNANDCQGNNSNDNSDEVGDPPLIFKSRKNVRKQIRRKNNEDEAEDTD